MSDVFVLCYHAVSERWPADFAVTPGGFERQLQHLVDRGYRGVTFTTAMRPLAWPRLSLTRHDSIARFRRQTSPLVRRLRSSRVGPAADRAYGAVLQQLRCVTHGSITRR